MDTTQAIAKLNQLDSQKRTKAGTLRGLMDHVERALNSGMTRSAVLKILNECGLDLSLNTFDNYLYRNRKKHGKQNIRINKTASIEKPPPLPQQNKPPSTSEPVKQLSGREALEAAMYNKDVAKLFNKPRRKNT